MFGGPHAVESERIGELDVLQCVTKFAGHVGVVVWRGQLKFVKKTKFHCVGSSNSSETQTLAAAPRQNYPQLPACVYRFDSYCHASPSSPKLGSLYNFLRKCHDVMDSILGGKFASGCQHR